MAAPLSGQTLNDRILAARHSLAGQGLAKAVCKATTEELIGPKKKHLDYLLHCTEEPNVSIPTLANLLIERAQSQNWIVVFKSLVTIHHLMCYGNERFVQFLASSNTSFQLSNFLDKSGVQVVKGYDMSPFVRRYANYLTGKSVSYRTVAFDFCKVKRGKDGGTLRQLASGKLLKTLPVLQTQLDALLDFEVTTSDLTNGVINNAFMLLFRDLIRLFACYNDGIINLLEKYFEMNKKNTRDALDTYKKFLIRMDRVAEFLKVAENVGVDKGDIPDLAKAPSSLLDALEAHLANLEGRKVGSPSTTIPSSSGATGSNQMNDKVQEKLLAEEEQAMAKYKEQQKVTNPFVIAAAVPAAAASASAAENGKRDVPNILDLFGMPEPAQQSQSVVEDNNKKDSSSADLLQLTGNPFANIVSQPGPPLQHTNTIDGGGSANAAGANFFGDILQPQGSTPGANLFSGTDFFEGRQPLTATNDSAAANSTKKNLVTGDLDASLANLTSNLNLTGGSGKGPSMIATRGPPMAASIGMNQTSNAFSSPAFHQPFQQQSVPAFPIGNNVGNKF